MERKPKQKAGSGTVGFPAVVMVLVLLVALLFTGQPRAAAAYAPESECTLCSAAVGHKVIPVGRAVGIKLFSDGVLVVGLSCVETEDGARCPGRDCGLKTGDVITHINGDEVDTIEQVQSLVTEQAGEPLTIQAMRGRKQVQLTAAPVENSSGVYQLGVWLRDSMAGIGTVTFYDPSSGVFAALGHGINDVDTAMLMPLETGGIMDATVADVKRGAVGQPGELHGQFNLEKNLGSLYANTERGIFGRLNQCGIDTRQQAMEVATRDQIHEGSATILSNVQGSKVEEYDVKITHISAEGNNHKDLMIQVTDPDLLAATGGIVQGMSGSPILQDGRIVGAVTHVLVNAPTRGYGILIENMLEAAKS